MVLDVAVTQFGGEIYSYVGDAMIASWPLSQPARNTRVAVAVFAARRRIAKREPWFHERFGETPQFRVVVHGGSVVAGECGDSRRQITYLGDVLNTTARLEALAKQVGTENIISRSLLGQLTLPEDIVAEDLGVHSLKGVTDPIEVNALVEIEKERDTIETSGTI